MIALAPLAAVVLAAAPLAPPPATPAHPVHDTYQGVKVQDPYQWLEKADDPAVQAWTQAQDARTRAYLGAFPDRLPLQARVRELLLAAAGQYTNVTRRGDTWFALKYQPPRQQPFLVTLGSLDDLAGEKVLLDPVALDPSGSTAMDFFSPSPDGALVAVSLSQKGTESGDVHVLEVATGKERPDRVPRVNGGTAGGGVAWAAGGEGFWYTRYPAPGERPEADLGFFQEVWFHRLGAPLASDTYEVGRDFDDPRIAEHFLQASEDGRRVLDLVQKGDGREYVLYVRKAEGGWSKVAGLADVEVIREQARSKDGTKIPLTVLRRKGTRQDGSAPALLYGYGSYGLSTTPAFSTLRRLLLDQGFVLAIANLRGGGEYGDAWHRAASLTHKQTTFDDMAACGQLLLDKKYTRSARLALQGGSAGGLLMGAMITQHPRLARAVVAQVGIFDMLRVELTPNGSFNITEFGTVQDPAQFQALYAYSPYHHVKKGSPYPAVLLTAGANDPRVDAWHAKKMAAALQSATSSKLPVLLRVSGFGHGMGTPLDERLAELTDVYAFIFEQLGVTYKPPPASPAP